MEVIAVFSNNEAIQVVVQLPKTGYMAGEMIYFTCSVRNHSRLQVKEVIFNFVQGFELIVGSSNKQILGFDGQTYAITNGTVPSHGERTWNLEIRVPDYAYNGDIKNCKIMKAFWELRVGVVRLPLIFSNLKISVPLTIGSIPFVTSQQTNISG